MTGFRSFRHDQTILADVELNHMIPQRQYGYPGGDVCPQQTSFRCWQRDKHAMHYSAVCCRQCDRTSSLRMVELPNHHFPLQIIVKIIQ